VNGWAYSGEERPNLSLRKMPKPEYSFFLGASFGNFFLFAFPCPKARKLDGWGYADESKTTARPSGRFIFQNKP